MSITAKYIGASTIQISTTFSAASGNTNMTSFAQFANTVVDAMTNTTSLTGTNGALSGTAFTADAGVTAQTSSGWTLFDSFWGGQNATTGTASPVYTQVFRSLNADGITYKNIIFRYNTREQVINTSTCEYWDTVANYGAGSPSAPTVRSPTNEAWAYFDCAPIGYNLTACDLLLNVSPRWCVVHSYLNNDSSLWSGVFENAREDIMDIPSTTGGYPCWGWISSTLWALGAATPGSKPLAAADHTLYSMPRTRQNYTGVTAAKAWGGDYGITAVPNWLATAAASFIYYLGNRENKFIANAWDTSRRLTLPIKPVSDYTTTIANYGQLYGIKLVAPIGANMNKITVATDANGNASITGTDRTHWLLNCHHKTYTNETTSWFPQTAGTGNVTWVTENIATGGRPISIVSTGTSYYCVMNGGGSVVKVNAMTKTYSTVYSTTGITDIKYDGERFIYITSTTAANAITRLDTADDITMVSVPVTGGFSALALSGDTVICSPAATATNIIFNRYNRTPQNAAGNIALANSTIATANATVIDTGIVKDLLCDFEGNAWAFPSYTVAANARLIKIAYNASSNTVVTGLVPGGIGVNYGLQLLNGDNMIAWHAVSAGALYQIQFNPRTNAIVGSAQNAGTTSALTASSQLTSAKIQGALMVTPNNSTQANFFFVNSLGKTITAALGAPVVNIDQGTGNALATAGQFIYFDGAKLFTNTETGLRVYSNVNGGLNIGGNANTTVTFGQVALPA
jgi:hypothetical protein